MITALDHIAVAVPDLEKAIKRFMEDFGLEFEGTEDVEAAQTSTAFFPLPPTSIELLPPRGRARWPSTWKSAAEAFTTCAFVPTISSMMSSG